MYHGCMNKLPSVVIFELQIKATRRYPLPLVGIVIIKKMRDVQCWGGCREKKALAHY